MREPSSASPIRRRDDREQRQSFTKIFRWRLPDGATAAPATVEIVGSFTRWQRVTLHRDSIVDSWHAIIHHIPGNRTHHYCSSSMANRPMTKPATASPFLMGSTKNNSN
jgi:hypothetical protein